MMRAAILLPLCLAAACSGPGHMVEPSLSPRAAEAIDPRVPIPSMVEQGSVSPELAAKLQALVQSAVAGTAEFDARAQTVGPMADAAGPVASESWVAANQALARLVEQYGVTSNAAAEIDALGAEPLFRDKWLSPAEQQAIRAARQQVTAIAEPQQAIIDRITAQLTR